MPAEANSVGSIGPTRGSRTSPRARATVSKNVRDAANACMPSGAELYQ